MKNISIWEVFSKDKKRIEIIHFVECFSPKLIIVILLTLPPISLNGLKICFTLMINVDKESSRPSSRKRHSTKLVTLILNLINVEDIRLSRISNTSICQFRVRNTLQIFKTVNLLHKNKINPNISGRILEV